jgi:hypothetical protein
MPHPKACEVEYGGALLANRSVAGEGIRNVGLDHPEAAAQVGSGKVFASSVAKVIKHRYKAAGIDELIDEV